MTPVCQQAPLFTAALVPFYPTPWGCVMFKYILRVRIGGRWLLAGVWLKWRFPTFHYCNMWWDYR